MKLLVREYDKKDKLDKNDLEFTVHQVILKGVVDDVSIQLTVKSTELDQLKEMVPIERGMAVELALN